MTQAIYTTAGPFSGGVVSEDQIEEQDLADRDARSQHDIIHGLFPLGKSNPNVCRAHRLVRCILDEIGNCNVHFIQYNREHDEHVQGRRREPRRTCQVDNSIHATGQRNDLYRKEPSREDTRRRTNEATVAQKYPEGGLRDDVEAFKY